MNDEDFDGIARALNRQNGASMAMQALVASILRALTPEQRVCALREFDIEREHARIVLLNSPVSEEMLVGFDNMIAGINNLRVQRPEDSQ